MTNGTSTASGLSLLGDRVGVIVSGGAPTLHLGAGALCAFCERGVNFDVIATSGAGALPGLLYMAPKNHDPIAALRAVTDMNVHDAIYNLIPSNFKVFFKYGPFAEPFYRLGQFVKAFVPSDTQAAPPHHRLLRDWIDFMMAAVTPTTLNYFSKSVLQRVQVVNDLIDWPGLPKSPKDFFLNAFDMDSQTLQVFKKDTMTPDAFYAGLAMPWLYPPTPAKADQPLYTEGASHDPSGIEAALENKQPRVTTADSIVVLDTITPDLWVDPESLYESLEITIMDPIVTLAEMVGALYALQETVFNMTPSLNLPKAYRLPFVIPPWERGRILEWSHSNALTLFKAGHEAAMKFCDDLFSAPDNAVLNEKYRYFNTLTPDSREGDFLKLFGDVFVDLKNARVPGLLQF